jgi:hypothetical protein
MVIVNLKVMINTKAKAGEPKEWISMRELWTKAGYSIPFNRWVKYSIKNYEIQPKISKKKLSGPGQPEKNYYIPLDSAGPLLRAIERRRHIEISAIK